jgi:hypothetical protein
VSAGAEHTTNKIRLKRMREVNLLMGRPPEGWVVSEEK